MICRCYRRGKLSINKKSGDRDKKVNLNTDINCEAFDNITTVDTLIFYGNAPLIGGDTFGVTPSCSKQLI